MARFGTRSGWRSTLANSLMTSNSRLVSSSFSISFSNRTCRKSRAPSVKTLDIGGEVLGEPVRIAQQLGEGVCTHVVEGQLPILACNLGKRLFDTGCGESFFPQSLVLLEHLRFC